MFTGHKSVVRTWVIVFLMLALSKAGSAQLVLYDNFKSNRIDPSKWIGTFNDSDQREVVRQLVGEEEDRRLHLSQTSYSTTTDDVGSSGNIFGLQFPVPNAITEISFTVVLHRAQAVGCTSNPQPAITEAEFRGNFFNTESSPASLLGEVGALIGFGTSSTDSGPPFTVSAFYSRCNDQFCSTQTGLDFRVLGSVQPDTANTLHIKWDKPNHRFVSQLNNDAPVVSPYTVSDSSPAFSPFKTIDVSRVVPDCTTTPRPFASTDAFFSNVYVNP